MKKKQFKLIFPILSVLILAPWPVAFAHENNIIAQEPIRIEAAEPSATPSWHVFQNAIGGIDTPVQLFDIDAAESPVDTQATLHLTNTQDLIHGYRYLILKVGVYLQNSSGDWVEAALPGGEPIPETYITLRNGWVSFTLPGEARYRITIDGGSYYAAASGGSVSPQFYLVVDQA
ncbi:hypothetical protein ACFLVB_01295 [Chloroflexota bacterium]